MLTTTTATTITTVPSSDYWTVIIASLPVETNDRGDAEDFLDGVNESGIDARLLLSTDYPTLNPGYWVIHTGFHKDELSARTACQAIRDQVEYCYWRYVGTTPLADASVPTKSNAAGSVTIPPPPPPTTTTWAMPTYPYYGWIVTIDEVCQPDSIITLAVDNYGDEMLTVDGLVIEEGFDDLVIWQASGWNWEVPPGATAEKAIELQGITLEWLKPYWVEINASAHGQETSSFGFIDCPYAP
ncbi:MAG: hypothetical protein P1T08_13230 [Acidimicrobiia bacterium]|nr:hypothetical protein [Acidimicrobiia bacterium]